MLRTELRRDLAPPNEECRTRDRHVAFVADPFRPGSWQRLGEALGFPIRLAPADQRALAEFAVRAGLAPATR
jgi:hypothetical protein